MLINRLISLINYFLAQRWVRFGLVGATATLAYFFLGLIFVDLLNFPVLIGNTLAYVLSFAVSYLGQSRWTFQAQGNRNVMLFKFAVTQAFGLGLNSLIVEAAIKAGLPYILAMLAAIAIVPLVVYLICKYWVFRNNKKELNAGRK